MASRAFAVATSNLSSNLATAGSITAASGSISGNLDVDGTVSMGSSFMRNRIINGAMDIWQRGTSFTPGNQYTADRWYCNRNGGVAGVTFSQVYGAFGSNKNWMSIHRANGNSASNEAVIYQPIEGINSRDLAGRTVTMSFTVCTGGTLSVTTNNIYFELAYQTTTTDIGLAGSWSAVSSSPISVPSNTGPTRYSVQFSVPSNATQLLPYVRFQFSGTASSDDRYYITEIQFEPGNVATPFERRPYGQELALCQRYYQEVTGDYAGYMVQNDSVFWAHPLRVTMRTSPTIAFSGFSFAPATVGLASTVNSETMTVSLRAGASGATTPSRHYAINGKYTASAEL